MLKQLSIVNKIYQAFRLNIKQLLIKTAVISMILKHIKIRLTYYESVLTWSQNTRSLKKIVGNFSKCYRMPFRQSSENSSDVLNWLPMHHLPFLNGIP